MELAQLREWRGWGAAPNLFETRKQFAEQFRSEREELEGLLTEQQYEQARASTLNAHYTNSLYAALMWNRLLGPLGAQPGAKITVYDNSVGAGRLLADAPGDARLIGTETDSITAAIAQGLFPHADIRNESFAKVGPLGEPVHVVVANVPYGQTKLSDKVHNPGRRHSIHNHAILQALNELVPGGLAALVTSRYTSDGTGRAHQDARRRMLEMAEFLGAIRLPDGAHMDEAGTPVVTDILVFRKRPEGERSGVAGEWLTVSPVALPPAREGITVSPLHVNDYFQAHPEMVLGTPLADVRRHGTDLSVRGEGDLAPALATALDQIAASAQRQGQILVPPSTFQVDLELLDGTLQAKPDGTFTEIINGRPTAHIPAKTQADELRAVLGLRDVAVALLDEEARHPHDTERMQHLRTELNRRYDAYIDQYGALNRFKVPQSTSAEGDGQVREVRTYPRMGGFRLDPYAPYVLALEVFDEETKQATKADLFHSRVISPPAPLTRAASPEDALLLCWDRYNEIRLDVVADLLDLDGPQAARQALGSLVYDDPETRTVIRATEYLSGNVRQKLAAAQEAAEDTPAYAVNVAALQQVIPRDLEPAEIESTLGAAWVNAKYVQEFLREVLEDDDIEVSNLGARWSVKGGDRHSMLAETTWGTKARSAQALASNLLNNQEILVTRKLPPDGPTVTDTEATAFAQAKALQLDERFRLWLWEDPDRATYLQRYYNDRYNARVTPTYDRERITAPGLSKAFTLNPHQHAAVARLRSTNTGVGLFHGTGAGKTLEMIVGGMELVRLGLVKKPVYAVPKGVLGQFQREFLQAYPRARILVADSSDLTGKLRHRFVAKWSTGNWDAVVISHTAFKKIPMSKAVRLDYIGAKIKRLEAHLEHADGGDRYTVKDIENQIANLKEKLEEELQTPGDSGVEFERTGSTFIFIDEFQVYKNLQVISSVQELALTGNQITADMDMKLSYLRSKFGERIVCAATATPVDNSPMEILSATKYLAPSRLAELGIVEDDQFVSTFIQPIHKVEMSVDGNSFKTRARYARYVNQPELKLMLGSFADVKLKRDLPLIEPSIIGGDMRLLTVDASPELREVMKDLGDRMQSIKFGSPRIKTKKNGEEAEDNSLWISTDGRLASLDVRLLGMETDQPQKLDVVADEIFRIWQEHRNDVYFDEHGNEEPTKGSNIAVFCDLGVPAPDKEFDVYNALADKLATKGMPRSLIEFAQDAKNQQQKVRQNKAINDGRIAVIMGGRIGLGTGRNIQRRGIAIVQVDPTWKATPIIQSLGRHKRQGNQNNAIHHIAAVTLDSYDPFQWQKVATKQSYADAVLDFRDATRIFESSEDDDNVIPAGVIFAVAANRPELEQMERVEAHLARLRLQQKMWNDEQFTYRIMGEQGRRRIAELTDRMQQAERALARRTSTQGDDFTMKVAKVTYSERREAGDALLQRLDRFERTALDRGHQHVTELGELGGFGLQATVEWGLGGRYLALAFPDAPIDAVTLDPRGLKNQDAVGLIRRLENLLTTLDTVTERSAKHVKRLEANMARAHDRAGQAFARQAELDEAERQYRQIQMALGAVARTPEEEGAADQTGTPEADIEPESLAERQAEPTAPADSRLPRKPESASAASEHDAPSAGSFPDRMTALESEASSSKGSNLDDSVPIHATNGAGGAATRVDIVVEGDEPSRAITEHPASGSVAAPVSPQAGGAEPHPAAGPQRGADPKAPAVSPQPVPVPAAEPFPNQREWTRALELVEAAEVTLLSASHEIWDRGNVPGAFDRLRHGLYAAIAAHEDREFRDAEASLTASLAEAERLLRTLRGLDRSTMQEPLRAFAGTTRDFLGRHRATVAQWDAEDSVAHHIDAQSRADMESFLREWAVNNQSFDQVDREKHDVRALVVTASAEENTPTAPAPTTPTPERQPAAAYPELSRFWDFGDVRAEPFGINEFDTPQSSAEHLDRHYEAWSREAGHDVNAETLQGALSDFHARWAAARSVSDEDWAGQLMAYTHAERATHRLADQPDLDRRTAGKLRYLARSTATHTERLALTGPADGAQEPLEALAEGHQPYANAEDIASVLTALDNAVRRPNNRDGTAKADPLLNQALLAVARTPQNAAAHLAAMRGLALATRPVSSTLFTYVGRLAATLRSDPGLADTAVLTGPQAVTVAYRDLLPAPPFATADGAVDTPALEAAHASAVSWARRVAQRAHLLESAGERQLAQLCRAMESLPLHGADGRLDAAWPHLLAAVAELSDQVGKELQDEGRNLVSQQDLSALTTAAADLSRRLHASLIESDGRLDDELAALTDEAMADRQLLTSMGTPASPLTDHAPVPFAPALVDWLREQADAMSPLLRHTLTADTTSSGWVGSFGRLAHALNERAIAGAPPHAGGRLPLPAQWQQHAADVHNLLDLAAADDQLRAMLVSNDPDAIRSTIRDRVAELVVRLDSTQPDNAFADAYFDTAGADDVLVAHVSAQTTQTARLAMLPDPTTLYTVRRDAEPVVVRGTGLAKVLGEGHTLHLNPGDGWTLRTPRTKRGGTVTALPIQDEAHRFIAAAADLDPVAAMSMLHDDPQAWPGILALEAPLQAALVAHAASSPTGSAEIAPNRVVAVGEAAAGEWLVDLPMAEPYPPGTAESADTALALVADVQNWLGRHEFTALSIDAWSGNAAPKAWVEAAAALPYPDDGASWAHWLAMASAHLHLAELHSQWVSGDRTHEDSVALTELRILLRRSDTFLARSALRALPQPASDTVPEGPGQAGAYASVEEAIQEDDRVKQWWRELVADRVGPVSTAFGYNRTPTPRLHALLGNRWHSTDPGRYLAALTQAARLAAQRSSIREESDDSIAYARVPNWSALSGVLTHHTSRWAATVADAPEIAREAARRLLGRRLDSAELEPGLPPSTAQQARDQFSQFAGAAGELAASDLLRDTERTSEHELRQLLTLVSQYTEPETRPELPALLNLTSRLAVQVADEQVEEQRTHPKIADLSRVGERAGRLARTVQTVLDQSHPDVERELAALTDQALANHDLMATVHYTSSEAGVLPYAPALWLWLEDRENAMSSRLRRVLHSNVTPVALVGAFGTLWDRLLDAAPPTGTAPDPLPDAGTPVPDAWAQWPGEVAALADAASSDIDLRLRLAPGRDENPDDLIALWTEHHAERHAQDTWPATMLAQYFDENPTHNDLLHEYLRTELAARLAVPEPSKKSGTPAAAAIPGAALAPWHLADPQGMGESEEPYPDQAAAREGALALIAALGEWTRTWSGAQYRVEKAIKEIADRAATALWADVLSDQIGTHTDAAHLTRQIVDLAGEFLLQLEEDTRSHTTAYRLADVAYDHAARMHATTVTLAESDEIWPAGNATGEQQRARELAQSIDRQMPDSKLLRRTGADTWDGAATYSASELYALAMRPSTAAPEWDTGTLTLDLGDHEQLTLKPVEENEALAWDRRIPVAATLQELAEVVDTAVSEPMTTEAQVAAAESALEALRTGTLSHLRGHFPDRRQIQAIEERLAGIGGGYYSWQEQAAGAARLTDTARQVRRELEDHLGRPSTRHAAVPAHHALTLLANAANDLNGKLLPNLLRGRPGMKYTEDSFLRDQQQITALTYLLQHLPHADTAPAEETRRLEEELRIRDGHHGDGEFIGELHRHQHVAEAAKALAEAGTGSRAKWAQSLHDAARHHTDRIARHLAWAMAEGQQSPSRVPRQIAAAPHAPTAAAYPQADNAQSELLDLVRRVVAEDDNPHRIGLAPVVLAALLDAQDRDVVYGDHVTLHAFAEELRESMEARRPRDGRSEALAGAAHAARSHAAILAEAARDSEPDLHLALLHLQRRAESDTQLMAYAEPGPEPAEAQRAFRTWLAGTNWHDGLSDNHVALLQALIARTGPGLGDGILAATWDRVRSARPSAIAAALAAEFPQGTVRKSITAFRNRRTPLMAQVAHVLALPAVRERLSSPHLDDLGAVVVRKAAGFLADGQLTQRSRAYRGSLTLARATRHLAEVARRADLPAADQAAIADLHTSAQYVAADWVASAADSDARGRLFLGGEDVPLCSPSPSTAPLGTVTHAERVIARALDATMEPAGWGGGGYQLESRIDGTTAILLTRTRMDDDGWRAGRTGRLRSIGWSVQATHDEDYRGPRGAESLHLVVDLPRGRQAEQWQLAGEVRSILEAHRLALDPTKTFDVRPATERHFPGGSDTTAVVVVGRGEHLERAGYATERVEGAGFVVTRPEGAVPVGQFSPASEARPASVRLHTVAAAMRPLHAELTDLLTLVHDRHPALFDITELRGMWDELTVVNAAHPLDTNPPGALGYSDRRKAVDATRIHHVLTWLQNGYVGQARNANQQVAELYGPGADRFIQAHAATLRRLLHDYAAGRTESARLDLARTGPDPDGQRIWDRYQELVQTPEATAPVAGAEAATARAAEPRVTNSTPTTPGTGQSDGRSGDEAAQGAGPGALDADGSGGNDQTPPPAPGGNDEPEQPQQGPTAAPLAEAGAEAAWAAFTRRRQISEPRRALSDAVRQLTETAYFRQRSNTAGVEAELRAALADYMRASLEQPHGLHDTIERLTAALAALSDAWPRADLPQDAAEALTAATSAGEELLGRWRATATSPSWESIFQGTPRPTSAQQENRTALSPGEDALPVVMPTPALRGATALPGIRLEEVHAVVKLSIATWGTNGQPRSGVVDGLVSFVRLMDDPVRWRAWRDELVGKPGIWLGGSRPPAELSELGRLDPAPGGIQISKKGNRQQPFVESLIRWEEVPAWVALGLAENRRQELLAAGAALESIQAGTPEHQDAKQRLDRAVDAVWHAAEAADAPDTTALATSWNRYSTRIERDSASLFDIPSEIPDHGAYHAAAQWTSATEDVITASWAAVTHPQWPTTAQALTEALTAFRAAIYPPDSVYTSLLLLQAIKAPGLAESLTPQLRPVFQEFAAAAEQHAHRVAATAWGEQWRTVFPTAEELWRDDPFLLPRLGHPDRRRLAPASSTAPLDAYESGNPEDFVATQSPDGRRVYDVGDAPGFRIVEEPGIWHDSAYTLRTPQGQVIATLVRQGARWNTVMGAKLPQETTDPVAVLPPQPYEFGNFRAAVRNALRVWAVDGGQPQPWPATYPGRRHLSHAFANLEPLPNALRTASRRIWPLTFEDQPALARVLTGLEQLAAHDRISLDDAQIRAKADVLEELLPSVIELRTQLEDDGLGASDLYGLVTELAGHAFEMPARLRATTGTASTSQAELAPTVQGPQEDAALDSQLRSQEPETDAPAATVEQTAPPQDETQAPIAEGAEWAPEFSVPPTVTQLWNSAKARGWTMTRQTVGSGHSQNLLVEVEADTARGRWAFTLRWSIRSGRFSADKKRSYALWADRRAGTRGGTVHPTIAEVLTTMDRHPAVPASPVELATTGTLREAVGELALRPETTLARAARPALLAAFEGLLVPISGHPVVNARFTAVQAAREAIDGRPTPFPKLQEQTSTAHRTLLALAEAAQLDDLEDLAVKAHAAAEVVEHWSGQFEDVEAAASRLTAPTTAATSPGAQPTPAPGPTVEQSRMEAGEEAGKKATPGRPGTQMAAGAFGSGPAPEPAPVPAGQLQLDSPATTGQDISSTGAPAAVSDYDALLLGGRARAEELATRGTLGEPDPDGTTTPVLLASEPIGSISTRPNGGYVATDIDGFSRGEPFETSIAALAAVVAGYDQSVADADAAREVRRQAVAPIASAAVDTAGTSPADKGAAAPAPAAPASPLSVPVADTEAQAKWEEANPRPSARLAVTRERTHVLVTGTVPGEEDANLREWLKSKHFSFVPETNDGRWDSNKNDWRRSHSKAAVFASSLEKQTKAFIATLDEPWLQIRNRIGQALTPELRAEYEHKARERESYPLTEQQRAIIDEAQDGHNVAVQALAGTGKTSTMVALARRMPNRRITYLAFNSANAADARLKFAGLRHVSVSTAHSLAARDLMVTDLAAKVAEGQKDGGIGTNANADWANFLGVQPAPAADRGEDLASEDIVVLIKETINNFRNSDSATIDLTHVPDPDHPLVDQAARPQTLRRAVLQHARDAWQDKINPASRELNFHHDDYLKVWALSRPKIHADTIVFDEAQDINPVLRKVVLDNMRPAVGPAAQVIIVGDPNQSIYAFRGAENALEDWPADIELPLNKSWRFGPEVADIANIFLKLLRAPYLVEGNDGISTAIGPIDAPQAVLGRSNAGVVSAVLAALEEGRKVHMVGGGDELKRMAEGAKELQENRRTRRHPELVPFPSWDAVRRHVDKHDSAKQLEVFVRLVDEHGADTLIDMVDELTENTSEADLIVATAHKSKGLEWEQVQVGTDFRGPKTSTEPGQPAILPADEELRLAYVTATRGMRELDLGSLSYVEELRALADEVYAAHMGVAPQSAPTTPQMPAAAGPVSAPDPAPAGDLGAPFGAPPARDAFQVLKAVEAQELAAPHGTLWWGGQVAGREKALTQPILVRLEIGQRGVVDVKDSASGKHIVRIRTGTPFFAAPATPSPSQNNVPSDKAQALASSSAAERHGSEAVPTPTSDGPMFRVEARLTTGGRRWVVLDAASREVVWVSQDSQALECVYENRAAADTMRDALALAPELRREAPGSSAPAAEEHRPGEVLPSTLGQVIAKMAHPHSQWVKVELRDGTQRIVTLWNPAGADLVQVGQSVYVSGTLGEPGVYRGRLETPVEGGTVEGEEHSLVAGTAVFAGQLHIGDRVRIVDAHHPAHAVGDAGDYELELLFSTVTILSIEGDEYTATTDDGRTVTFTLDDVAGLAATSAPTTTPGERAEDAAQVQDVTAALLADLRKLSYAQRSNRWSPEELQPNSDRRVEVLLRTGEWTQVAACDRHNLRDSRGRFHGLEEVMAWRDGTQLATLLDQPKTTVEKPQDPAPPTAQQPAPRPPLISRPVQSMLAEELEERARLLDEWITEHTPSGDTGLSVRAVQQRDQLRAELAHRRNQEADAAKASNWDGFSDELGDLDLEPVDLFGSIQEVRRDGTLLGTVTVHDNGYRFQATGARVADSTLYDSPEGAAVALARQVDTPRSAPAPAPAPPARKRRKAPAGPVPRFLVTAEDGPDASPSMLLKAHLRSRRVDPADPDQLGQRKVTEFCHRHGAEHAGTHLSKGGRLAILTIGAENYELRTPDRLTKVFGPWGDKIPSRERANAIAAALESIRDEQGRIFPWDAPHVIPRGMHFRDQDGNDMVSAIRRALVQHGLDEPDGRYARAYEKQTGKRLEAPELPAAEVEPEVIERDPAAPEDDFFDITTVKRLGEVAGPDGSVWWKGEVSNPRQGTGPRTNLLPLTVPRRVRVAESDSEKGAEIGWFKVLDADTGEHLENVRSTSYVLVAAPLDLGDEDDEDRRRSAGQRFSSVGQVRTHFVGPAMIKGISGQRRNELRRLAKDRELVELTDDGQFAIRHTGETYEVIPVGSGLDFDGILPDLYLTASVRDDLEVTPQPLGNLPSLEGAHAFAARAVTLMDTAGKRIDWSDPALAQRLSPAGIIHMNHQLLRERALFDRENGREESPSDAMWRLLEPRPEGAPEPEADHRWADQLTEGDWAWLSIDDRKPMEIISTTPSELGTVILTLDDGSTWHFPQNLPVEHPGDAIVLDSTGEPLGLSLDRAWVSDGDVIEFDIDAGLRPSSPGAADVGPPAGLTRVRGRAKVTHQHPHGGGERTYLLDATLVTGNEVRPAPVDIVTAAFELPPTVHRLSARAPLAPQPASAATPVARPLPRPHLEPEAPAAADLQDSAQETDVPESRGLAEGEALRQSLIDLIDDPEAPTTPTEHSDLDGTPLYVRVTNSATSGRVLQFGFDPAAPRAAAQFTRDDLDRATARQVLRAVLKRRPQEPRPEPGPIQAEQIREDFLRLLDDPGAPDEATLHGTLNRVLPVYVAVTPDPQHHEVLRFGFDPNGPAAAQFTRAELQGVSYDKIIAGIERYGAVHVANAVQASKALSQLKAGAKARQTSRPAGPFIQQDGQETRERMRQPSNAHSMR
ncbi:UvrD-helicase domain-containing protein [Streptomyces sp. NPDC048272]|uniref:UvrD-helicase domain-containing protein n=1 Tax=Streptomyces sp. NPDC048272 TaxID=3154616 RepID=UPI0034298B71